MAEPILMDAFWSELSTLADQLERHFATNNVDLAERLVCRCDTALELLRVVYARVDESIYVGGLDIHSGETEMRILMDLTVLIRFMQQQSGHYSDIASSVSSGLVRSEQTREVCRRGQWGRPPFVISLDQLEALIELGLSMRRIASVLGVSERTVRRRQEMYALPIASDRYTLLLDHELDRLISDIMQVSTSVFCIHIALRQQSSVQSPSVLSCSCAVCLQSLITMLPLFTFSILLIARC